MEAIIGAERYLRVAGSGMGQVRPRELIAVEAGANSCYSNKTPYIVLKR